MQENKKGFDEDDSEYNPKEKQGVTTAHCLQFTSH
jgi:hypothetical protein